MPNRILREGILTSPRVTRLGWAEEVFYRRLHSVVDDFGRYFADHGLLRAACYPRQLNKVSDSDIGKWLQVIADAALVRVYPAQDGERYLEVLNFGQQVRAKKSKFPDPSSECVADAKQVPSTSEANAPVFVSVSEGVSVSAPDGALFDRFYAAYPKKKAPADARKAFDKTKADEALLQRMLKAIEAQKATEDWQKDGGKFIPYPASWLNAQRWLDEVGVTVETSAVSRAVDAEAAAREAERLAQLARARSPEAEAARKAAMAQLRRAA